MRRFLISPIAAGCLGACVLQLMMKEFLVRMPPEEEEPPMEIRDRSEELYEAKKLELAGSKDPYKMCVAVIKPNPGRSIFF